MLAFLITILQTGGSASCVPFCACTKSPWCFRISLPSFDTCNNAYLLRWGFCRGTLAPRDPLLSIPRNNVPVSFIITHFKKKKFRNPFRVTKKFKVSRLCACKGAPSEFLTERTFRSSTSPKFFCPRCAPRRGSFRRCPCGRPCEHCRRLRPSTRSFCKVSRWM